MAEHTVSSLRTLVYLGPVRVANRWRSGSPRGLSPELLDRIVDTKNPVWCLTDRSGWTGGAR
jgi:hypothetical protein